jgi:hypothetical protein
MQRARMVPILLAGFVLGCAAGESGDESVDGLGETAQPIINGMASTAAQDFVVAVAASRNGVWVPTCTGTLVAKNLVITARHCVGDVEEIVERVADFPPAKIGIFTGVAAPSKLRAQGEPSARGAQLFSRGRSLVPDIAVILLDTELDNPIASIRLDGGAVKGEELDIVGYGLTERNTMPLGRRQRQDLTVNATAPESTTHFNLLEGEFQFGEGACSGDSGGPALSASGALVGVATRVSSGRSLDPNHPASFCVGNAVEVVYTELSPLRAVIEAAFETAGASPWIEGELSPAEKKAEEDAAAAKKAAESHILADGCAATGGRPSDRRALALVAITIAASLIARRRRARPAS